jgi:flavin-binding protein dodecin
MSRVKTIDIVGASPESSDAAVHNALAEARRTVRGITGVDVLSRGLREDGAEWRVRVRVAFRVEEPDARDEPRRSASAEAAAIKLEEREEL